MTTKLLAIDDSKTMRKVLEITFAGNTYDSKIVGSAEEALASLKSNPPQLVVLDGHLGKTSGYDLCQEIKSTAPQVKVILLSSKQRPFDSVKAAAVGVDDHFDKPFDSTKFLDKLSQIDLNASSAIASAQGVPTPFAATQGSETSHTAQQAPLPMLAVDRPAVQPSTAAVQSSTAAVQSSTAAVQPSTAAVQSSTAAVQSSTAAVQPSVTAVKLPPTAATASTKAAQPTSAFALAPQAPSAPQAPAPAPLASRPAAPPLGAAERPALSQVTPSASAHKAELTEGTTDALGKNGQLSEKLAQLGLTNDQVLGVLALSREVVEQVVWEVVPHLAETLIKEEIARLTAQ